MEYNAIASSCGANCGDYVMHTVRFWMYSTNMVYQLQQEGEGVHQTDSSIDSGLVDATA